MADTALEVPKDLPPSTDEKQPVKNLSVDAFHHFLQGKRHMLVKDYSHAVQSLSDALELYVEHYGQIAPECGEIYFWYGKALFNLFQHQAGIFGDTMPDDSDEDEKESGASEEEEKDKDENGEEEDKTEESNDGNEESNDGKEDDSESVSSSKDGEKMDTGKSEQTENNNAENVPTSSTSAAGTSSMDTSSSVSKTDDNEVKIDKANEMESEPGPSSSKEKAEEEITDLQLAWENLETAKSIFQKLGDQKEPQLKIAEILLLLGEINLESDNYEAAIRDLKEGLDIWQRHLSTDDRRMAEIFYQLGLAHQLNNESDKALDYFQHTVDVIQLRINILKNQKVIEKNEDGFEIDPKIEIADLEALLPDIKSKMEDTKDIDKETKKAMQELVLQRQEESNVSSTSEEKPVKNINHLLKRKKPEDQESNKNGDVKKLKLSNSPAKNIEDQQPSTSETSTAIA